MADEKKSDEKLSDEKKSYLAKFNVYERYIHRLVQEKKVYLTDDIVTNLSANNSITENFINFYPEFAWDFLFMAMRFPLSFLKKYRKSRVFYPFLSELSGNKALTFPEIKEIFKRVPESGRKLYFNLIFHPDMTLEFIKQNKWCHVWPAEYISLRFEEGRTDLLIKILSESKEPPTHACRPIILFFCDIMKEYEIEKVYNGLSKKHRKTFMIHISYSVSSEFIKTHREWAWDKTALEANERLDSTLIKEFFLKGELDGSDGSCESLTPEIVKQFPKIKWNSDRLIKNPAMEIDFIETHPLFKKNRRYKSGFLKCITQNNFKRQVDSEKRMLRSKEYSVVIENLTGDVMFVKFLIELISRFDV